MFFLNLNLLKLLHKSVCTWYMHKIEKKERKIIFVNLYIIKNYYYK